MLAAAEYGLNPQCHIYQMPSKKLVTKFKMQTRLKCISMAFSRCGKYLILLGGVPDFNISIYDIEEGKMLPIPETSLPCSWKNFISCAFNPSSKKEFSILSDSTIYFYTLVPAFAQGEEMRIEGSDDNVPELADSWRLDCVKFESSDVPVSEEHQQNANG